MVFSAYDNRFDQARSAINNEKIRELANLLDLYREQGRNIVIVGNGGSMALASHFAQDLNKGLVRDLNNLRERRFKVHSLSDNATISAYGNDVGYDIIFAQQCINLLQEGGFGIVISASGNSSNILKTIEVMKNLGIKTYGILGFDGGKAKELVDDYILAPTQKGDYRVAEDLHLHICHKVIEFLSHKYGLL